MQQVKKGLPPATAIKLQLENHNWQRKLAGMLLETLATINFEQKLCMKFQNVSPLVPFLKKKIPHFVYYYFKHKS